MTNSVTVLDRTRVRPVTLDVSQKQKERKTCGERLKNAEHKERRTTGAYDAAVEKFKEDGDEVNSNAMSAADKEKATAIKRVGELKAKHEKLQGAVEAAHTAVKDAAVAEKTVKRENKEAIKLVKTADAQLKELKEKMAEAKQA
jgi:hypothetical protein